MLSRVVHTLRDHRNTIVVIEQNLDVTETADRVIDLGPEGGAGDGMIIAPGTSEDVAMKWSPRGTQMPFPDRGLRCRLTGDRLKSAPARGVVAGTVAGPLP